MCLPAHYRVEVYSSEHPFTTSEIQVPSILKHSIYGKYPKRGQPAFLSPRSVSTASIIETNQPLTYATERCRYKDTDPETEARVNEHDILTTFPYPEVLIVLIPAHIFVSDERKD